MAFRFFDLPGEIRREIYCQLLINQGDCDMPVGGICQGKGPQQTVEPAMLRVCKRMHDETAHILYGQNEFYIYIDFYRFEQFLFRIGKDNSALIKKICFRSFSELPGLYVELPEAISLTHGPLQCLEKITIVHSRHLPSNDRPHRNCLFQSDIRHVCNQIAKRSNLVVLDEGGLEDGPKRELKTQMTIRFAVPGELKHQTKDRVLEVTVRVANAK